MKFLWTSIALIILSISVHGDRLRGGGGGMSSTSSMVQPHEHNEPLTRMHQSSDMSSGSSNGMHFVPLVPHRVRYGSIDHAAEQDSENEHRYGRRRLDRNPLLPTTSDKEENRKQDLDTAALYQGYGTHYVDLWVGTPHAQRQTLIVDTGSSVTAFPCSDCQNCGTGYHTDSYFRPTESSSFRTASCGECVIGRCNSDMSSSSSSCDIGVSYQEGSSWRAVESVDAVYTGGPHDEALAQAPNTFDLHFGCQTSLTGLFKTQLADGIMGMEMEDTSLWKQMYATGTLKQQSFSLCFSRQPVTLRDGTGAGAMTLGGTDGRLHDTTMVYANQRNDFGWYVVRLKNIYLRSNGGDRVQIPADVDANQAVMKKVQLSESDMNNGNVILDSGTTDTYLTSKLAIPFNIAWQSLTGTRYNNNAVSLTEAELTALPTVLFQLEVDPTSQEEQDETTSPAGVVGSDLDPERPTDVLVAMGPTHYMEYNGKTNKYTSRLYFNENHGGVLGANFMMGHDVFFDVENSRVGFAESECSYDTVAETTT